MINLYKIQNSENEINVLTDICKRALKEHKFYLKI